MEDTWGTNENDYNYVTGNVRTGVLVNGTTIPVEPESSFRDTIKNISLDAGYGKYRVILNGSEIRPSEAPVVFSEGDLVELRPYDEAGC
jgi:hypothetical protein